MSYRDAWGTLLHVFAGIVVGLVVGPWATVLLLVGLLGWIAARRWFP